MRALHCKLCIFIVYFIKHMAKDKSALKIPGWIKTIAKILEVLSPGLAVTFAMRLFTTPVKFKIPKRDQAMDAASIQQKMAITSLNKTINISR